MSVPAVVMTNRNKGRQASPFAPCAVTTMTGKNVRRKKCEVKNMTLKFYMPMNPPRTTAQQKRVVVSKSGRQLRFESDALRADLERSLTR